MSCVKITLHFSQSDVQDNGIQRLVMSPGNARRGGIKQLALLQKDTHRFASSSGKRNTDSLVSILESRHDRLDAFQLIISELQLLSRIISWAPRRDS